MNKKEMNFPVGIDSFEKLREEKGYYIDKTELIRKLVSQIFEVQLITRPRRFGKTLAMSMLADFFDIEKDSRKYFKGLKISREEELCAKWENKWPVIFLTLKNVNGESFEDAFGRFKILISDLCVKYHYLAESDKVNDIDKAAFYKLADKTADKVETCDALYLFTRMMRTYYGKTVILLIDEYDVPLAKANENGYYDRMLDVIRSMFDKSLKSNEFLKFAVVTGCLKIAKESVFTGVNNFVTDTVSDSRYEEYFGFTKDDVQQLLTDSGLEEYSEIFKEWYDGYHFGAINVYCPWDVLNYARDLQSDMRAQPGTYWANSSGNHIIRSFLRKAGRTTKKELETLIAGKSVLKKLNAQLTYNELEKNITNLWSFLYMTGYLTAGRRTADGRMELIIPNREICEIYITQINEWFEEDVIEKDYSVYEAFCRAFIEGKGDEIERYFNTFLRNSISIRDTFVPKPKKENFYHGILMGLFMSREDWYVHSNSEEGEGYSDIHVEIEDEDTAFIIEVKYAENGEMEEGCQAAMAQIQKMHYADDLRELGFETVYVYGIACYKKKCKVLCCGLTQLQNK